MSFINSDFYFFLKNSRVYKILHPIWRFYYKLSRRYMMKRHACELLENMREILDAHHILFWLDFGTLLGAYRENDFISHDCDLDIAIFYEDAEKVKNILKNTPFKLTDQYRVKDGIEIAQLSYVYKSLSIDICCYHRESHTMFCYICSFVSGFSISDGKQCKVAVSKCTVPYSGFGKLEFQKSIYNIPAETAKYLSAHYGENFMIPNTDFDSMKDAPNIVACSTDEFYGICIYGESN